MRLVNGAEPPRKLDGTYEDVDEEKFNLCTDCGEELKPHQANDAFGTEWATCEACLYPPTCNLCGHDLTLDGDCFFCDDERQA